MFTISIGAGFWTIQINSMFQSNLSAYFFPFENRARLDFLTHLQWSKNSYTESWTTDLKKSWNRDSQLWYSCQFKQWRRSRTFGDGTICCLFHAEFWLNIFQLIFHWFLSNFPLEASQLDLSLNQNCVCHFERWLLEMLSMFWLDVCPPASHLAKIQSTRQFGWQNFRKTVSKFKETPHQPQSLSTGQQKYDKRKLVVSCWVYGMNATPLQSQDFIKQVRLRSFQPLRISSTCPCPGVGATWKRLRVGVFVSKKQRNWRWEPCRGGVKDVLSFFLSRIQIWCGFKYDGNDFRGVW